ncbi:MAG: LacI family DNA-binding transcriptional regulator [Chloroflexi bacterium]|nr:LacI family DNA-binding transcriptional regulator [Chloroflexota bacterium]
MDAKNPRINLLDVARHAGVSPATVSRVLNNTAPVRESVRSRVLSSMKSLGYEPPRGKTLAGSLENALALLIPDILNPFFAEVVRGVQDEARSIGYVPILFDSMEDPQREEQYLRMLMTQPMNGTILCGSRLGNDEFFAIISRLTTPMVILNRTVNHSRVACVRTNLEAGTWRATRHLLDLQHTRIAFLTGPISSEQSLARRRGVEKALGEAGLSLHPEWCPASFPTLDGGFQAMSALLTLPVENRPTAVIAYNDLMAMGVLHAIRTHHLRAPEDISVIGVDDIAMAAHANPPLTTIAQPKYQLGRLAMQTLRRMLQGYPPPEEGFTLMESSLIVRESTALAPNNNGVHV